jgi:hypothetical protein
MINNNNSNNNIKKNKKEFSSWPYLFIGIFGNHYNNVMGSLSPDNVGKITESLTPSDSVTVSNQCQNFQTRDYCLQLPKCQDFQNIS